VSPVAKRRALVPLSVSGNGALLTLKCFLRVENAKPFPPYLRAVSLDLGSFLFSTVVRTLLIEVWAHDFPPMTLWV